MMIALLSRSAALLAASALLFVPGRQAPAPRPDVSGPRSGPVSRPDARAPDPWATRDLRAGIIGTDTSHVTAFTTTFQEHPEWRIRVVAAYKGGSPDVRLSATRVEGFAKTIQEKNGVEIVGSIDALLSKVDVVLLESVDARTHLAQITPVLRAHKAVFVDKPLAASVEDGRRIAGIAKETGTPLFSTSSYRYHPDVERLRRDAGVGKVVRVETSSPLNPLEHHPDLYYYGVHGVEALYAVLGTGCVSVSRHVEGPADVTEGRWRDGRIGIFRGMVDHAAPAPPVLRVVGEQGTAESTGTGGYDPLVLEIAKFFQTGQPPVDPAETLEVLAFMSAAQISKERGGASVVLDEVMREGSGRR